MTPRPLVLGLIGASVALNAAAQLLLRVGMRSGLPVGKPALALILDIALRPGVVGGLACYAISLVLWLLVLSRTEASFLLLGESFTLRKLAGTLIIAAGVAVMAGK